MAVCHRLRSLMERAVGGLTEGGLSNVRLRLNLLRRHHRVVRWHIVSSDDRFALTSVCNNEMSGYASMNF